jgi:hypothetical protein
MREKSRMYYIKNSTPPAKTFYEEADRQYVYAVDNDEKGDNSDRFARAHQVLR